MKHPKNLGGRRRVSARNEIADIFRRGSKCSAREFAVTYVANRKGQDRLGVLVGKRHGNAVERNRLKRIVREAVRQCPAETTSFLDVLVQPRAGTRMSFHRFSEAYRLWRKSVTN
ncbi:MAG: ribonuclease P protein component [Chitinivibrionales bacterium]|nr:ribonuclease P protein component [Chitinivibrionales bacterium]